MNVAGGGGGRTGPYWRRQLGITLPGERTGAELSIINQLRAKQGLPPEGGLIGDNTRFAAPDRGSTGLLRDARMHLLRQAIAGPDRTQQRTQLHEDAGDTGYGIPENDGQPFDEVPGLPGVQGMPQVQNNLRQTLLDRFAGQAPMITSRDALRRYVANHPGRVARPGVGRQPILPQRQPRRAVQARPY